MKNCSSTGKVVVRLAAIVLSGVCATGVVSQSRGEVDRANDPVAALRTAKLIYVKSSSGLVGASAIEAKLQKRAEFSRLGLVITREYEAADIILELHHDRFTKYVYTAIDHRTGMVVASGKVSSLGGTVANKVAKRFLKQVIQARATEPKSHH